MPPAVFMRFPPPSGFEMLTPREAAPVSFFIDAVRREIRADLVQASLFGSRARGTARLDSDIDILLVFRRLPPDREPHATHAERIAEAISASSGIPVTTWAISLIDLEVGNRTPMLIDALEDSAPLWCAGEPLPPLPFTPWDARQCVEALMHRLEEGRRETATHLRRRDLESTARRLRDDLVRACTAVLLAHGITRPRRGEAALAYRQVRRSVAGPRESQILNWVARSYGPDGRDEEAWVAPPPFGPRAVQSTIHAIGSEARRLAADLPRS